MIIIEKFRGRKTLVMALADLWCWIDNHSDIGVINTEYGKLTYDKIKKECKLTLTEANWLDEIIRENGH